jgi:hypothetical protein
MKHFSDALLEEPTAYHADKARPDISKLCKKVTRRLNTFGGNCGSFALALCTKLTELGHTVDLVICSNMQEFEEDSWTESDKLDWYLNGEPDIYHVVIRLDGDNNQLYDGDGATSIENLIDFCYDYYRDGNADISAWIIEDKQDYDMFYKIFRFNTNMSAHPIAFETVIDNFINIV